MRTLLPLLLATLVPLGGCYFTRSPSRPVPALEARRDAMDRQRCLVVMIPGFLDGPDTYLENRFPHTLTATSRCDAVMVDLHYRYYGDVGIADLVYTDVILPAAARGYEEIWLLGISMGGLGTLLTAERYTSMIDGIILLAPFVGDEGTLRTIREAGGAATWRPPSGLADEAWTESNYTLHLWSWLRRYHTDPDGMPPIYIGWGDTDRLGEGDALLAALLPEDQVFSRPGGHGWSTWRPLFDDILEVARPGL